MTEVTDLNEFARRYVEVWNVKDDEGRRSTIAELFAPEAEHFAPAREARGYEELFGRITRSFESWVAGGEYAFRSLPGAVGHHGGVHLRWAMVKLADDSVVSTGYDFVRLNEKGQIVLDYQFVDG